MKVLIELQEDEFKRLIGYLLIYREGTLKITSENAYQQVSELISKLQGEQAKIYISRRSYVAHDARQIKLLPDFV